ncbi:MAG: hypothetical protein IPP79_18060 [Chitinophagaceae bacterium]|nr:hypothetical protein [Chitinophagaceae bacterium]
MDRKEPLTGDKFYINCRNAGRKAQFIEELLMQQDATRAEAQREVDCLLTGGVLCWMVR